MAAQLALSVLQRSDGAHGRVVGFAVTDEMIVALGVADGGGATLVASSDARQFAPRATLPGPGLRDLLAVGDALWACGEQGQLAVSRDHGARWQRLDTGTGGCLLALALGGDGAIWVVGEAGYAARVLGERPRRVELGTAARLASVHAVRDDIVVLCDDGKLVRWRDGAVTAVSCGASRPLTSLSITSKGTWLVTGEAGFVARSPDGAWFSRVQVGGDLDLEASCVLADGTIAIAGDRGQLLVSTDDARTWRRIEHDLGPVHLWSLERSGDGLWIGGEQGLIARLAPADEQTEAAPGEGAGSRALPAGIERERPGAGDGEPAGEVVAASEAGAVARGPAGAAAIAGEPSHEAAGLEVIERELATADVAAGEPADEPVTEAAADLDGSAGADEPVTEAAADLDGSAGADGSAGEPAASLEVMASLAAADSELASSLEAIAGSDAGERALASSLEAMAGVAAADRARLDAMAGDPGPSLEFLDDAAPALARPDERSASLDDASTGEDDEPPSELALDVDPEAALAQTEPSQWAALAWQWLDDGAAHRALLARLDDTQAAQIVAIDQLAELAEPDRAAALPRLAAALSPELEAVLVGSLVRDDQLDGVLVTGDAEDADEDDGDEPAALDPARVAAALAMSGRGLLLAPDDDDVQFTHAMLLIDADRAGDPARLRDLLGILPRLAPQVRINVAVRLGKHGHPRFAEAVELALSGPLPERVLGGGTASAGAGAAIASFGDVTQELFAELGELILAHAPHLLARLVPLLPDDAQLLAQLAAQALGADQHEPARALYDRFLALDVPDEDDGDARTSYLRALNNACIQAHAGGAFDVAVRIADRAQPVAHENPYIYHAAACAYAAVRDHARALEQVKLAIEHDYEHVARIEGDPDLGELLEWPELKALFRDWHARQEGN